MSQTVNIGDMTLTIGRDAAIFELETVSLRFERRGEKWKGGIHSIKVKVPKITGLICEFKIDPAVEKCCTDVLNKISALEIVLVD